MNHSGVETGEFKDQSMHSIEQRPNKHWHIKVRNSLSWPFCHENNGLLPIDLLLTYEIFREQLFQLQSSKTKKSEPYHQNNLRLAHQGPRMKKWMQVKSGTPPDHHRGTFGGWRSAVSESRMPAMKTLESTALWLHRNTNRNSIMYTMLAGEKDQMSEGETLPQRHLYRPNSNKRDQVREELSLLQ